MLTKEELAEVKLIIAKYVKQGRISFRGVDPQTILENLNRPPKNGHQERTINIFEESGRTQSKDQKTPASLVGWKARH